MKRLYSRTILLLVLLNLSYSLFARTINRESTEKIYIKTTQELSSKETRKIAKLNKNTYIISNSESYDVENLQYFSPIWEGELGGEQYAIDNSILLYDVSSLSVLIRNNNLSNHIISIDSITGEPVIYILSLQNISYQQIDSICAVLMAGSYCKIAEPNYVYLSNLQDDISPEPENNTDYANQWGLHNNTYPQYDINAREAWRISTGAGIKVAVIDVGFELVHPDLINNIYSSYDCTDGADGSVNGEYMLNIDSHGTQCAGVIAATNNNIGVIGVAPDSKLILLRRGYSRIYGSDTIFYAKNAWHINALRTAYQLGADVISNSWSVDASSNDQTIFDEVLSEAYTLGRAGKGSVVVFSTGNQYKTFINYPSNSPYTISVGAMNNMGHRCSFSNYGQDLDIVAPGYYIRTTQIIPYGSYCYSSGTSFAAPMVAGIAALILSVNSNLTCSEVGGIIRRTAYKLPYYDFNNNTIYGSWNNEVGYGLADAYAAVISAAGGFIQGPDYVCDTTKYYLIHPSQPGDAVLWSVNNGNYIYPHYSIIGANNQDTVYIRCERASVVRTSDSEPQENSNENTSLDDRQILPVDQSVSVSINNGTSNTYTKMFRNPFGTKPEVSVSNTSSLWNSGTSRTFTITNCTDIPDSALTWEVKKTTVYTNGNPSSTSTSYYTGRTLTYTASTPRYVTSLLQITITNTLRECDPKYITKNFVIKRPFFMSAHTDGDMLYVSIAEDEDREDSRQTNVDAAPQMLELWHNIYGCMRTQHVRSSHEQIDITGLPQGVYVLILKENGNIIAETKVQID
jgi:subtilisin family serine protease